MLLIMNDAEVKKHIGEVKIVTLHKSLQIYKPIANNIGPKYDQFRDCIDIAAKIGMSLNLDKPKIETFKDKKNF